MGAFQIEFDDVPWLVRKNRRQREFWWERSRRLQHGTLVCLWIGTDARPILYFGVIADRDVENLAGPDGEKPKIGVR